MPTRQPDTVTAACSPPTDRPPTDRPPVEAERMSDQKTVVVRRRSDPDGGPQPTRPQQTPDEDVDPDHPVLVMRPHWRVLVRPVTVLFADAATTGYLGALTDGAGIGWLEAAVLASGALAVARWSAVPWLRWLTTVHTVTRSRVYFRSGVVVSYGRTLPLHRISDVSYSQHGLVQRLLGCGTLLLSAEPDRHAAATNVDPPTPYQAWDEDPAGGLLALADLPAVARVQRDLLGLVEQARAQDGSGPPDGVTPDT